MSVCITCIVFKITLTLCRCFQYKGDHTKTILKQLTKTTDLHHTKMFCKFITLCYCAC